MLYKYIVDKSEATKVNEALTLLSEQRPNKGEEIMTIAESLRQQGMEKGIQQGRQEVALNLLRDGMAVARVAEFAELEESEVLKLAEAIH